MFDIWMSHTVSEHSFITLTVQMMLSLPNQKEYQIRFIQAVAELRGP